jgi:hypothetical protein
MSISALPMPKTLGRYRRDLKLGVLTLADALTLPELRHEPVIVVLGLAVCGLPHLQHGVDPGQLTLDVAQLLYPRLSHDETVGALQPDRADSLVDALARLAAAHRAGLT